MRFSKEMARIPQMFQDIPGGNRIKRLLFERPLLFRVKQEKGLKISAALAIRRSD